LAGEAGYESYKKNYEKAGDLYKKAGHVSSDNVLNPEYLLNAGINYMKVGKNAEAKELFDKIKKDYTNSTAMREVERYSIQLE
jgi:tetratricopeptide (TPR) repeat protein